MFFVAAVSLYLVCAQVWKSQACGASLLDQQGFLTCLSVTHAGLIAVAVWKMLAKGFRNKNAFRCVI